MLATVEVWEWISNAIPHLIMGEITFHAGIEVKPFSKRGI